MTREQILELRASAEALGLVIMPNDEYQNQLAAKAGDVTRNVAEQLEKTVLDISGIAKDDKSQKYYEYAAAVMRRLKLDSDEYKKVKDAKFDEILKQKDLDLEVLRQENAKIIADGDAKVKQFQADMFNKEVSRAFDGALISMLPRLKKFEGLTIQEAEDLFRLKARSSYMQVMSEHEAVKDEETGEFIGFVKKGTAHVPALILREPKSNRPLGFADLIEPSLGSLLNAATAKNIAGPTNGDKAATVAQSLAHYDNAQIMDRLRQMGYDLQSQEGYNMYQQVMAVKQKN